MATKNAPLDGLSPNDVMVLQQALDKIRGMNQNPRSRPTFIENDHQAADVFIAVAPDGGIAACVEHAGTGSGSSVADVSYGDCKIYDIRPWNGGNRVVPMRFTERVYNLMPTAIAAGDLFLAVRDKAGNWIATQGAPVTSSGGGGSGTSGPCLRIYTSGTTSVDSSIPGGINVSFSAQDFDPGGWWDLGTPTDIILPGGSYVAGTQGVTTDLLNGEGMNVQMTTPSLGFYGAGGGIAIGYGGGFVAQPSLISSTSFQITGSSATINIRVVTTNVFGGTRTIAAGFIFWCARITDTV